MEVPVEELWRGEMYREGVPAAMLSRPARWGEDSLTFFLDAGQRNSYLTANWRFDVTDLVRRALEMYTDGLHAHAKELQSRPLTAHPDEELLLAFLMAGYNSLMGAATLTFSHQLTEAPKLLRGAIECAMYAYHCRKNPSAGSRWTDKPPFDFQIPQTGAMKKKRRNVGREFSVSLIAQELEKDDPKLADAVRGLYQRMIDTGGHYNVEARARHEWHLQLADRRRVFFRAIGATEGECRIAVGRIARVAVCCLYVLQFVFEQSWGAAGLNQQLEALIADGNVALEKGSLPAV